MLTSFHWWSGQCPFKPPSLDSDAQGSLRDADSSCPSAKGVSDSIELNQLSLSGVRCLLFGRGPITIFWFVVPVVIGSFHRVFRRRLWPHVFHEVDKGRSPSIANRYSASAPQVVFSVSRVVASAFHFPPRPVFRRTVSAALGLSAAPARLGSAFLFPKITTGDDARVPTLAVAEPEGVTALGQSGKLTNNNLSVMIARFVCSTWRQLNRSSSGSHWLGSLLIHERIKASTVRPAPSTQAVSTDVHFGSAGASTQPDVLVLFTPERALAVAQDHKFVLFRFASWATALTMGISHEVTLLLRVASGESRAESQFRSARFVVTQ